VAVGLADDPRRIAEEIGADQMLFGSDFPHPEGLEKPLSYAETLAGFDARDVRKIMGENLRGLLEPRPGAAS
jgi:predicted TIM-barrel fold metal-dependent hydrolase